MNLSYVHGVATTPLIADTLGGALNRASERWGDRDARARSPAASLFEPRASR